MIDLEDAPLFSECAKVDVELLSKLMKLAGLASSQNGG
jgi:hypothetical protein